MMDGQGLVYVLDLAGSALAKANARIKQLEAEVDALRASQPPTSPE